MVDEVWVKNDLIYGYGLVKGGIPFRGKPYMKYEYNAWICPNYMFLVIITNFFGETTKSLNQTLFHTNHHNKEKVETQGEERETPKKR